MKIYSILAAVLLGLMSLEVRSTNEKVGIEDLPDEIRLIVIDNLERDSLEGLVQSLIALGISNKSWRDLIFHEPRLKRFLELARTKNIFDALSMIKNQPILQQFSLRSCAEFLHKKFGYLSIDVFQRGLKLFTNPQEAQAYLMSFTDPIDTLLIDKVKKGDIATVFYLLIVGANVNAVDRFGDTPLLWAARGQKSTYYEGNEALVRLLLDKGANVNIANRRGNTPLIAASANVSNEGTINLLLNKGANVNAATKTGVTPLQQAAQARGNSAQIVKLFLEKGAHVNSADDNGWTPLMYAARDARLEAVELLLQKGAEVNVVGRKGETPLLVVLQTPIFDRFDEHDLIIKMLIEKGANVDVQDGEGNSPLMVAIAKRFSDDIVNLIAQKTKNFNVINKNGDTLLIIATRGGYSKYIDLLLAKGVNINKADSNGWTPLMYAAQDARLETVELLLRNGADVNVVGKKGETPLLVALQSPSLDRYDKRDLVIKMLIEKGANVDVQDSEGNSPLMVAITKRFSADIIDLLFKNTQNFNIVNKNGDTLLMAAARAGYNKYIDSLIAQNNIHARNLMKYNALMLAAVAGHIEVMRKLIANGAEISYQDIEKVVSNERFSQDQKIAISSLLETALPKTIISRRVLEKRPLQGFKQFLK